MTDINAKGSKETISPEAIAAHVVGQKISRFPDLADQIRQELLEEMVSQHALDEGHLEDEARRLATLPPGQAGRLAIFSSEELVAMQRNALIDTHAASHLSEHEIDECINFVRKRKRALALRQALSKSNPNGQEVWQRLREFCGLPLGEKRVAPSELLGIRAALIEFIISGHLPYLGVAKHHITIRGICDLAPYIIGHEGGSGRIGGKSAGMLLAMSILHPTLEELDPELAEVITAPKSFFFRSDAHDAFKEFNPGLEVLVDQKYKDLDQIAEEYPLVCESCLISKFPPDMEEKMRDLLEEVGEHPLIVRSSSYLEDNSGFAFSGKYTSVFVANQGTMDERLAALEEAMKEVYASTYSPDVMTYRRERGLLDYNERMCLLVQEVVGSHHGRYFYPAAAGVAVSTNNFIWSPRIKREDGLLRLVMGLGTRAVDRVGPDYTRLVPLTEPLLRPEATKAQIIKYSQRLVDVLNLETNQLETVPLKELLPELNQPDLGRLASVDRGGVLTRPLTRVDPGKEKVCLTFEGLLSDKKFSGIMRKVLRKLEEAIGQPVEVEFAYEGGKIYILQCRAYSQFQDVGEVAIPTDVPQDRILFTSRHGYSSAVIRDVEYIVYVDAPAYHALESGEAKMKVASLVGQLNRLLKDKQFILMGPGRWGSNNIDLGVKVTYADINHCRMLIEMAWTKNGSVPDVSYGTHFFHDLVEGNIIPLPIYPEAPDAAFNREFFAGNHEPPPELKKQLQGLEGVVKVLHVPSLSQGAKLQIYVDGSQPMAVGFLGPAASQD